MTGHLFLSVEIKFSEFNIKLTIVKTYPLTNQYSFIYKITFAG